MSPSRKWLPLLIAIIFIVLLIVTPYGDDSSNERRRFNFFHSSARMVIERAFGRLKHRWRILLSKLDHKLELIPFLVMACVILHNWLINKHSKDIDVPFEQENDDHDVVPDNGDGNEKRDLLCAHVLLNYEAINNLRSLNHTVALKRAMLPVMARNASRRRIQM
jgi:hypothetical protein